MKMRLMRPPAELHSDPRFDYAVGRLVGATEMLTNYVGLHGDERARGMAGRVLSTLSYFLEEQPDMPDPITPEPSSDEAITREIVLKPSS